MSYTVRLESAAWHNLKQLPPEVLSRIIARLSDLEWEPRARGVKKLKGVEGYRIRVGDYRILFTVDDQQQTLNYQLPTIKLPTANYAFIPRVRHPGHHLVVEPRLWSEGN